MPNSIIDKADSKVSGIRGLKDEIDSDMAVVNQKLVQVNQKIKDNLISERNPNGLLKRKEGDYLKCLELNHCELES